MVNISKLAKSIILFYNFPKNDIQLSSLRRVWRYQKGNQNP